jgi:hypothetical protein
MTHAIDPPEATRAAARHEPTLDQARGFVLIGVVMFVLALTILGLSLFSLSGYEAQFLGDSWNKDQAFYLATGGVERAKFALVSQRSLSSVTQFLPNQGVVYARAMDTVSGDTLGPVNFNSNDAISIRVLATYNGMRSMVETRYRPQPSPEYYKRLATTTTHLEVNDAYLPPLFTVHHGQQTFLSGEVLQNEGAAGTVTWGLAAQSPTLVGGTVVPAPAVSSVISANWGAAQPLTIPPNGKYLLNAGGSKHVSFFKMGDLALLLGLWDQLSPTPEFDVNGYAVLLVRQGMRFENKVTVKGSGPNDCLVILAEGTGVFGPSLPNQGTIWFFGGLDSPNVPVILVANGRVEIEQDVNGVNNPTDVDYLSIFNDNVISVSGPNPGHQMVLHHDPSSPYDAPNGLIDDLANQGVLPNASPTPKLTLVRGTWRQLDPDNPPQN